MIRMMEVKNYWMVGRIWKLKVNNVFVLKYSTLLWIFFSLLFENVYIETFTKYIHFTIDFKKFMIGCIQ